MSSGETFVPLEPWMYHSPRLKQAGRKIDIGLLAEALVYYDTVYVGFTNDEQFARLVAWFQSQGKVGELIALLQERALVPYYYAFLTLASNIHGVWDVVNIQDAEAAAQPVFAKRVLESERLMSLVRKHSVREELRDAAATNHVEVKAADFGAALRNAESDYDDPERSALLVQIVVDELYRDLGYVKPPVVEAIVDVAKDRRTILWNFDFEQFSKRLGHQMAFDPGMPLAGASFGVKTLWSAAQLGSDLYVGAPLRSYVDYKLEEGNRAAQANTTMERLVAEAAFPDVRDLVNHGQIGVRHVLQLRSAGRRFRAWLRSEGELERDVLLAYLGEFAQEAGWTRNVRKVIAATGIFGGAAAGAVLGGPLGAVGGALVGEAITYIFDLAAKVDEGWRPKVFGDYTQKVVDEALKEHKS